MKTLSLQTRTVAGLVLGGILLLFAFSALYVAAYHAPRARGFDVGVVGSPARAAQVQSALDARARGAFDVHRYADERSARAALLNTDVHGVLVPGVLGDEILVAGASGRPRPRPSPARSGRRSATPPPCTTSGRCPRATGAGSRRCSR